MVFVSRPAIHLWGDVLRSRKAPDFINPGVRAPGDHPNGCHACISLVCPRFADIGALHELTFGRFCSLVPLRPGCAPQRNDEATAGKGGTPTPATQEDGDIGAPFGVTEEGDADRHGRRLVLFEPRNTIPVLNQTDITLAMGYVIRPGGDVSSSRWVEMSGSSSRVKTDGSPRPASTNGDDHVLDAVDQVVSYRGPQWPAATYEYLGRAPPHWSGSGRGGFGNQSGAAHNADALADGLSLGPHRGRPLGTRTTRTTTTSTPPRAATRRRPA